MNQPQNATRDFASLGDDFSDAIVIQPLKNTFLIHKNTELAERLSLDFSDDKFLKITSGEEKLHQFQPRASIYAGHQFGHFSPQLGDGRSCLIGQSNGYELSLKGAGTTPCSRGSDGRAVLRSSIREYLCSAAMRALGIPTTEALSLVGSHTEVYRENIETGAIITRVAKSHIRFGSFELFASRGQTAEVKKLLDFVIEAYYPECIGKTKYTDFLSEIIRKTAVMIAGWQAVGFAHGVMNTDNMSILGLTLDYGPFGFVEQYNPAFVCNHSDHHARYSFEQQPSVALWNLTRLSDALRCLISENEAKIALDKYESYLVKHYAGLMLTKFGFDEKSPEDQTLIRDFFTLLQRHKQDYINTFRALSTPEKLSGKLFDGWLKGYNNRLSQTPNSARQQTMNAVNPKYILRNYLAEATIRQAEDRQNYDEIQILFDLLNAPFDEHPNLENYANTTPDWAKNLMVSCSS